VTEEEQNVPGLTFWETVGQGCDRNFFH